MIKNIRISEFYKGENYFHPAISECSNGLIMTMQTFSGASDTYGPPLYSLSHDKGKNWNTPVPIDSMGSKEIEPGITEGFADGRPLFHKTTGSVILTGCNNYYCKNGCVSWAPELKNRTFCQFPIYAVYDASGNWSKKKKLAHEFFSTCNNWRTACAQALVLENGQILLPIYFQRKSGENNYSVCTAICTFDGNDLTVDKISDILSYDFNRGFIEPSLAYLNERYYMTIRAEDNHAYLSISHDGIHWGQPIPWAWDDGSDLKTSSTQQHWLSSGKELYLAYTREDECNKNVIRWRSPLFASRFDIEKKCLIRNTEKLIFPLRKRKDVPNLLGNFHVLNMNNSRSIVSDGSLWLTLKDKDTISSHYSEVWTAEVRWGRCTLTWGL